MDKLIIVKYGELFTKGGNRNIFINTLVNDIKRKLKDIDVLVKKEYLRLRIEYKSSDETLVLDALNRTFGIHSYMVATRSNTDVESIKEAVLSTIKDIDFKTFKVEVNRPYKKFEYNTMEFMRVMGGVVLRNVDNISVDVHNPDLLIKIEITKDNTYIYTSKFMGLGGYPINTLGEGLLMLSGGIDSPVAGYLAAKRGMKLSAIYFEAIPHTSIDARNKVISLARELAKYGANINLHIINFTALQEEIYKKSDPEYVITIMRRMMYRISELVAKKYNIPVIISGDSMGQVASQTLESINVIDRSIDTTVIRPLVAMDKIDIIDISKNINTYDISILPYDDCCTVFVPKHPVIKPTVDKCIEIESRFDYESFIEELMDDINTVVVKKDSSMYDDVL